MISPTVGRVVWYYPAGKPHTDQPYAATVAFVHDDNCINVGGFDMNGHPFADEKVLLVQGEDSYGNPSGGSWACWMPYQKGQAAKTDALEKMPPPAFGLEKDIAAQQANDEQSKS